MATSAPPNGPILIIEDVDNLLQLLDITLKFKGFTTETATDGQEGYEKIDVVNPALVITDIMMPRMDGYSLLQKIRTSGKPSANIPVVLLTATYVTPEDREFALSLGATRFVTKPIDTEQFVQAIRQILAETDKQPAQAMDPAEFYARYKDRLENKLKDKNAHISRIHLLLPTLSEDQKRTYAHILAAANADRQNIINELAEINTYLQNLPQKDAPNE